MKKYIDALLSPMVITFAAGRIVGELGAKLLNKVLPADWKI